ncbi:MAG: tryptophan-rich sensory protein [Ruminococcus sp.]|nr:tryptophan-rich sensory protein [Ruminococcus sp.]
MKKINRTDLIISVVFAELVGAVSALLSGSFKGVYAELTRPPFSPPAWLFPVVWAILYALMGISAYIISKSEKRERHNALKIYFLQLAVNFLWSILFFRFMLLNLSALTAVVLAVLVALMIYSFLRINRTAGLLNIPYFVWTVFASYLAIGTAILN